MAYKLRLEIDAQPEKFSFLADLDSKVLRVKPNGDYDVETSVKNSHVKHGLHDEPINDSSKPTVDTYNHLGHKIASTDDDDPTEESNPALNSLDSITDNLTPDKPVGIGDTWTVVLQPNAKLKREAGKVVYTLSGIEKQGDYQTLKIVYKYKETEKDVPLTAEGYVMVSQSDFSLVRLEGTLKGAKLSADPDFPNGDATLSLIRN
ncbi:MAG: hypothetical protein P4L46_22290 [Fimbriimonas sp.]|nr:hypothetical protein [Fimbriimonas sp.]